MNKDLKLANDCAQSVNAETPLGKMALEIYDRFCKEGNDTKDFSAISKVIGGNAWDYPID
jgi:3-hydroxyisobutyrate dehydrogenase